MIEEERERSYFPISLENNYKVILMRHEETGIPIVIGRLSPDLKTINYYGTPEELLEKINLLTNHWEDIYLINENKEEEKAFVKVEGFIVVPKLRHYSATPLYLNNKEIGYIFSDGSVTLVNDSSYTIYNLSN